MSDLIERDKAIDVLDDFQSLKEDGAVNAYAVSRHRMATIPSARQQGEWKDTHKVYCGSTVYACSECKSEIDEIPTYYDKPMYKWCPYCGAEMTEKESE